jgi:hypothetical protein
MKKAMLGHILLWCFFLGMGSTWTNADRVLSIVSQRMAYTVSANSSTELSGVRLTLPQSGSHYEMGFAEKAEEDKFHHDPSLDSAPSLTDIFNPSITWDALYQGRYTTDGNRIGSADQARHILLEVFRI